MVAIYTKDGLTVHFSSKHPAEIENVCKGLLHTAAMAINGNIEKTLSDNDAFCISETIRLAAEMLPLEFDLALILQGSKDELSKCIDTLL